MENYTEKYTLKNGTVLVNVLDYCGDDDFYAMYDVILDVLAPDSPTYGVDSMCIDGSFKKDGLLVRMCSESAYDQCCFVYDPAQMSAEEVSKVEGWINQVVEALRQRRPKG
ncbi:MAG: histidine kinase [Oscillospiraceae bacterium]|nr:histidine kinase [Oscillospiraceae bacterium]